MKKTVLLAILDGVAIRAEKHGNAAKHASKPNFERIYNKYPHKELHADGLSVGLPVGQMGNSEVGHLNIGLGRVVYQSLVRVNQAIEEDSLKGIREIDSAMKNGVDNSLHLLGLLSDGGVHSHINHLFYLLKAAKDKGIKNVYLHLFLDGRDVSPNSGIGYVKQLQAYMDEIDCGQIVSISGRYYAMDRDKRWDRVQLAYDTIVNGKSKHSFTDPIDYIQSSYDNNVFDEFIMPAVNSQNQVRIEDNDSIIFYNFRPDRAIQLSAVLTNPNYDPKGDVFKPTRRPMNLNFVQMMKFSNDVIGNVAFKHQELKNTLGDVVANYGMHQLRIAETEKYPHVTFFFDGGIEKKLPNSKQILIDSPKVATYDLQPEMSAYKVTEALLEELNKDYLDLVILNFANPDMVGHTGMLDPTVKAIEVIDECLGKIISKIEEIGGNALITADHGNAEMVTNDDGTPNTSHTTNPVSMIVVKEGIELTDEENKLADIAPTLLDLLGVDKPIEMTGKSIIK